MDREFRCRQRDGDEVGLQGAEKRGDVVEPFWRHDRNPIAGRPATSQLLCNDQGSLMKLRPGDGFGEAGRVQLVVDERVGGGIGLPTGSLLQQCGKRRASRDDRVIQI